MDFLWILSFLSFSILIISLSPLQSAKTDRFLCFISLINRNAQWDISIALEAKLLLHTDEDDCSKRGRGAWRKVSRSTLEADGRFIDSHGSDIGKAWITKSSLSIPAVERLKVRIDVESSTAISIPECLLTMLAHEIKTYYGRRRIMFPQTLKISRQDSQLKVGWTVNIHACSLSPISDSSSSDTCTVLPSNTHV